MTDPNQHSCGTVYPRGAHELSHPEPGVYLAGTKSYGRAPTFLAMTGVCGGAGPFDSSQTPQTPQTPQPSVGSEEGGCCTPPALASDGATADSH